MSSSDCLLRCSAGVRAEKLSVAVSSALVSSSKRGVTFSSVALPLVAKAALNK